MIKDLKKVMIILSLCAIMLAIISVGCTGREQDKDYYNDDVICTFVEYHGVHIDYVSDGGIMISTTDGTDVYLIGSCQAIRR